MRPGDMLAIHREGSMVGTAGGGVAETVVASEARAALVAGSVRGVCVDIDDATAQLAGLPCGGRVEWRIEPLRSAASGSLALIRQVVEAQRRRQGVVLCTRLSDGRSLVVNVDDAPDTGLAAEAVRASAADSSRVVNVDDEPVFFQVFNAQLRLFVIGAVHIAQALVPAARLVGFDVTVVDPRPGFAQPARFPGAVCVAENPALALRMASLDSRSAVVTLSHDADLDDPALVKALHSRAFYVGALGSRKTHKARLKRLHEVVKLSEVVTARLHGPAGLPIGAIGPAEIAASIVAEVVAALRGQVARVADTLAVTQIKLPEKLTDIS